jgi:hypothetical protein
MSNPTTPFNWQMPTNTDLVTDLPADFEVFGQGVATSMADLLGGTTGQILAKATNADMDFTWIANDQGDITGVTATSPLTGGGTSGAVTVGIQDATTAQKGAVQLENSTSSTSTTTAAVPANVKSAYDLANGAIAKTTLTTAGDVIYRDATVPVRLGIGTAGQVLTVNSGATAPAWAPPAGGGGNVLQVIQGTTTTSTSNSTSTYADTSLSASITPTSATSKVLVMVNQIINKSNGNVDNSVDLRIVRGATTILESTYILYTGTTLTSYSIASLVYLDSPNTTSATTYKTTFRNAVNAASVTTQQNSNGSFITLLEIGA